MPGTRAARTVGLALLVEGGLGVLAIGIGWLFGFWPAIGMSFGSAAIGEQGRMIGLGVLATFPPVIALVILEYVPLRAIESVRDVAEKVIRRMFPQPRWWQLAAVSIAAGWGEELLFRGLIQAGLANMIPSDYAPWIALAIASAIFGVFHYLNATYAVLATIAGLYFGWLMIATESLWPPIVAHALYDFVALCHLLRPSPPVPAEPSARIEGAEQPTPDQPL
jgi:membrane protease YdiL (CAAX protease family)